MWKKFKNLKLGKKIIIVIIAIIFLPVTLLLLSIKFLIKSIKSKKKVFSVISIFLVLFMLLVNYGVVEGIILMQDPEYMAEIEAEHKVRDEQAKKEKAEARKKAEEEKARKEQEKKEQEEAKRKEKDQARKKAEKEKARKEQEKAEQKAKKEQEKREKEEAKRKAKEEEAQKKAEAKKKAEEEKARKKAAEEFAKSDLGILSRSNHPTYYGSVKQAKEVWKDVSKDKALIGNDSGKLKDTTILSIGSSGRNSDLIEYIEIYFDRFLTKKPTSLKEVLKIASDYLPSDIMKKYYSFNYSYKVIPKDDRKKSSYYIISYHLSEKGKKENSKNHQYSGTVDIMIEQNHDGSFNSICIKFGIPRWLGYLDKNGYQKQTWDYDLMNL